MEKREEDVSESPEDAPANHIASALAKLTPNEQRAIIVDSPLGQVRQMFAGQEKVPFTVNFRPGIASDGTYITVQPRVQPEERETQGTRIGMQPPGVKLNYLEDDEQQAKIAESMWEHVTQEERIALALHHVAAMLEKETNDIRWASDVGETEAQIQGSVDSITYSVRMLLVHGASDGTFTEDEEKALYAKSSHQESVDKLVLAIAQKRATEAQNKRKETAESHATFLQQIQVALQNGTAVLRISSEDASLMVSLPTA